MYKASPFRVCTLQVQRKWKWKVNVSPRICNSTMLNFFRKPSQGVVHLDIEESREATISTDSTDSTFRFVRNPFRNISWQIPSNPLFPEDDFENPREDPLWRLSYFERISVFLLSLVGSYSCYAICFIFFPLLSLKPRKFALIWTIGSLLFLLAFVVLNGPRKFWRHAATVERLPFTVSFVASISATLAFSVIWKHTLLVIVACVIQAVCSLCYTISYFPYGRQGLEIGGGIARARLDGWLAA